MPKNKSPRQRPPKQGHTQRPHPRVLPKTLPKAKKGTINLTVFEAQSFQEMVAENQSLVAQREQLEAQSRALQARHDKAVKAFGETHELPPLFSVQLNKAGTGLNWREVREDAKPEDDPRGAGTEASPEGD